MRDKIKELWKKIGFNLIIIFMTYPFGVLLGLLFQILKGFGIIRVIHEDRLPINFDRRILVSNHPSVIDPWLAVALFFKEYFWTPLKRRPVIMADKKSFYDPWYFFGLRPAMVPVERGDRRKEAASLIKVAKVIEQGSPVIVFPEGGRTFKGKDGEFLCSPGGKKIRPFKGGVGLLAARTNALIIPIWIEGSDHVVPNSRKTLWTKLKIWRLFSHGIDIKIGYPIDARDFSGQNREEITQAIVISLLRLADEAK